MKVGSFPCYVFVHFHDYIPTTKILTRRVELRNFFSLFSNMKIPQSNFCNEIYSSFSYFFLSNYTCANEKKSIHFNNVTNVPCWMIQNQKFTYILLQSKAQIPLVSHIKFPFQEQQMSFCAQQFCIYCIVFHSAHKKKKITQWSGS